MPRIFDNIDLKLLPDLQQAIEAAYRADFCVGYFNLRGWKEIASKVDEWPGGDGHCVRLLVGMQKPPQDELQSFYSFSAQEEELDNPTKLKLKKRLAEEFKAQLTIGAPTDADEASLRKLARQLREKKVQVKLFLRHTLHAKLYLLHREDRFNPIIGYLGSSNLTFAGLSKQGELNVDVLDSDASQKLAKWFEERWVDWGCIDISEDLIKVIEESWAREEPIPPYHIYLKMAYHLSQEARAGLSEFSIPSDLSKLMPYQSAAVKIAAHHIEKRGGVMIGDVVGLGKTLVGTAIARVFGERGYDTLIICPKNLVKMWEDYRDVYHLAGAKVLSVSRAIKELPKLRRYRLVLIDESHNLRNREGKRYRAIRDYIDHNESKVVLLTATPYNKTYLDLSSQLRLFLPEDQKIAVRPEQLLREMGEIEFIRQHQADIHTLAAFEHSHYAADWQELMRLYMVRRTRSFIKNNYSHTGENGRKYLLFENGERSYFPERKPQTVKFKVNAKDPNDQYVRLYDEAVVETISNLALPRYGLGQDIYVKKNAALGDKEKKILGDLSRAGQRLIGFSRTNLFKRLESSGYSFLLSVERHILRNHIFLYALENNLPLPIGTQEPELLDNRFEDEDKDGDLADAFDIESLELDDEGEEATESQSSGLRDEQGFISEAGQVYERYRTKFKKRFAWLDSAAFKPALAQHLRQDANALLGVLNRSGEWNAAKDTKLEELVQLATRKYPAQKVLIFTQYADTVRYLDEQLKRRGVQAVAGVTGKSSDPTELAWRFSPVSNEKRTVVKPEDEIRILVATDVLSEGQNLQDCAVVVNYDLPWAIIRLIQRAGRVDRIGQKADTIYAHTFLPAEGVETIIKLRDRLRRRLKENAEVVGSDESFFEDDRNEQVIVDLYNEKAGILDGEEADSEVDLASYAFQIWKNAIDADPQLQRVIPALADVAFSTKPAPQTPKSGDFGAQNRPMLGGVLVYVRTGEGNDALAWVDENGQSVSESQYEILRVAECAPETPALPKQARHHELVRMGVEKIAQEEKAVGGQLGRPSGARFRAYERLKNFVDQNQGTLFVTPDLLKAIDEIYRFPLREYSKDVLNRQLRSGVDNQQLAELVVSLRADDRLCITDVEVTRQEPKIICSLGLA